MSGAGFGRVGLIGRRGDPQLVRLGQELAARGRSAQLVDLTDLPAHARFHWQDDALLLDDGDLRELEAVYARTAVFPMPTFVPGLSREEAEARTFPVRETGALLSAIVATLAAQRPFVNPLPAHRFHSMKPFLYRTLQRAGVPVPEFAVGCDLAAAAHFVDAHDEEVVLKPLMGGPVVVADFAWLEEHHAEVDRRPLLLQRRIRGRSLRAYVVGGRVVAAAEMLHGGAVDWRADLEGIRPVSLLAETERLVARAAVCQDLHFAAVDLEEEGGPEGAPWIIDVNPAPMFVGFETRSGLDVAGPLAAHLCAAADAGALPELPSRAPTEEEG